MTTDNQNTNPLSNDALFFVFGILAVLVFLFDIFYFRFERSAGMLAQVLALYFFIGSMMFPRLARAYDNARAIRFIVIFTSVSVFVPLLAQLFANWVALSAGTGFIGTRVLNLFGYFGGDVARTAWVPIVIIYLFGWPNFVVSALAKSESGGVRAIFLTINVVVWGAILALFFSAILAGLPQTSTGEYEPPTWGEVYDIFLGRWVDLGRTAIEDRRNDTQNFLNRTLPSYYTGQVERQQGQDLGVVVSDLRSFLPRYEYDVVGQPPNLTVQAPEGRSIDWMGVLRARTFASDIPVSIACVYEWRRGRDVTSVSRPARPENIVVRYTGEQIDMYTVDCSIPMDALPYDELNFQAGQFYVKTNFSFETWGYSTYTFMDSEQTRVMRMNNQNPASVLGIPPSSRAFYTPGPVRLGMPSVTLPVQVDVGSGVLTPVVFPAMGVTIENAWLGRGEVSQLDYVVVQVPLPFTLDTDLSRCSGVRDAQVTEFGENAEFDPRQYSSSYSSDERILVSEGYTWYVFTDIEIPEQATFITIRCPVILPADSGASVLNPDLSARQFTFVTQARYDFETTNLVPVQLGLVRT